MSDALSFSTSTLWALSLIAVLLLAGPWLGSRGVRRHLPPLMDSTTKIAHRSQKEKNNEATDDNLSLNKMEIEGIQTPPERLDPDKYKNASTCIA